MGFLQRLHRKAPHTTLLRGDLKPQRAVYYYIGVLLIGFSRGSPSCLASSTRASRRAPSRFRAIPPLGDLVSLRADLFLDRKDKAPNYIFCSTRLRPYLLASLSMRYAKRADSGEKPSVHLTGDISRVCGVYVHTPFYADQMDIPFDPGFFYWLGAIFSAVAIFSLMAFSRPPCHSSA